MLDKVIYETIKFFRNKETVKFVNEIMEIDNSNLVMENVYLGNIIDSQNLTFLTNNNIGAIVNCTENEPFHPYFDDLNSTNNKYKIRLEINDSKDAENLDKFLNIIDTGVEFINTQKNVNKQNIFVHCYWGLMRSATVVAGYLMKYEKYSIDAAIELIKNKRPYTFSNLYNFRDILVRYQTEFISLGK